MKFEKEFKVEVDVPKKKVCLEVTGKEKKELSEVFSGKNFKLE